jgi:hypothetical protein
MAQADSVPSSSRQLITGESANQSTSLRAITLPPVSVQPVDRHRFIGASDASVIRYTDEAPVLWLWRGGDVEPEALSNDRWYGVDTGQVSFGLNIGALFYATAVFLLGCLPKNILLILLRFLSRNKRLRFGALDKVSSNQLIQSRPQRRLK